jgi:group I intron endonuclease
MYFIYVIENLTNGKMYIGQTLNPDFRWKKHKKASLDCPYLHRAIRKYGRKNFDFSLIQNCMTLEEANIQEAYWITVLRTLSPQGYNLKEGGLGGGLDSPETREKKRLAKLGENNSFYGHRHSEESKTQISESKKGKKLQISEEDLLRRKTQRTFLGKSHSTDSRSRMSDAQSGEKHNFFGRKHSPETLQKMSQVRKSWWANRKAE